jgi:hypothetical protein
MPPRKATKGDKGKGKGKGKGKEQQTTPAKIDFSDEAGLWEIARGGEKCRWDQTPPVYKQSFCINVSPSSEDRAFMTTTKIIKPVQVWDLSNRFGFTLHIPAPYIIHIWWIQLQAKFWLEVNTGKVGMQMGRYLLWLIDRFVGEVIEDSEEGDLSGDWQSAILHPFLCRTFFHIREHTPKSDCMVVAASVQRNDDPTFRIEDLNEDHFKVLYSLSSIVADGLRHGG